MDRVYQLQAGQCDAELLVDFVQMRQEKGRRDAKFRREGLDRGEVTSLDEAEDLGWRQQVDLPLRQLLEVAEYLVEVRPS